MIRYGCQKCSTTKDFEDREEPKPDAESLKCPKCSARMRIFARTGAAWPFPTSKDQVSQR